jgi:hypothetical protein
LPYPVFQFSRVRRAVGYGKPYPYSCPSKVDTQTDEIDRAHEAAEETLGCILKSAEDLSQVTAEGIGKLLTGID